MLRKIVNINEDLCNGCGQCATACAEGAIRIVDGKARLVSETYCDGLGACLGECPEGAITIEEREAEVFDEKAVEQHLRAIGSPPAPSPSAPSPSAPSPSAPSPSAPSPSAPSPFDLPCGCPGTQARVPDKQPAAPRPSHQHPAAPTGGCPGAQARVLGPKGSPAAPRAPGAGQTDSRPSALRQWPVQLHLVSPQAAYFQDCDLLIAADCVAFAMGDFHERLLEGRSVAIACPKLDNTAPYVQKLAALFSHNTIRSITVAIMEVPCCRGLEFMVEQALKASGKDIPLTIQVISLDGSVKSSETRGGQK